MNASLQSKKCISFIRAYFQKSGLRTAVVGLSGGLDSAVTLSLCARALGKKNVIAVLLPSSDTPKQDISDAKLLAGKLCSKSIFSSIEPALAAFGWLSEDKISKANLSARIRMMALYAIARKYNGLVVGTGDKSEMLLGYFTKHGDGAADLFPLGGLYKTEVRILAKQLGIPARIISKPSSPALWKGQTAEKELGFTYETADAILKGIEKRTPQRALEKKFGKKNVSSVLKRMKDNRHKLLPAPVCEF